MGSETANMQLSRRVNETSIVHIYKDMKIPEEVGTKDGSLDICHDENPAKVATKSEVEGEGTGTISRNGGTVHSLEGQICMWVFAFSRRGWEDAYLSAGVHQQTETTGVIGYIK